MQPARGAARSPRRGRSGERHGVQDGANPGPGTEFRRGRPENRSKVQKRPPGPKKRQVRGPARCPRRGKSGTRCGIQTRQTREPKQGPKRDLRGPRRGRSGERRRTGCRRIIHSLTKSRGTRRPSLKQNVITHEEPPIADRFGARRGIRQTLSAADAIRAFRQRKKPAALSQRAFRCMGRGLTALRRRRRCCRR